MLPPHRGVPGGSLPKGGYQGAPSPQGGTRGLPPQRGVPGCSLPTGGYQGALSPKGGTRGLLPFPNLVSFDLVTECLISWEVTSFLPPPPLHLYISTLGKHCYNATFTSLHGENTATTLYVSARGENTATTLYVSEHLTSRHGGTRLTTTCSHRFLSLAMMTQLCGLGL